jgi:hypothetical protein
MPKTRLKAAQILHEQIMSNHVALGVHTKVRYALTMKGVQAHYNTHNRHQVFHLRARSGGSTRPSSMKCGYIISHSDGSKSTTDSRPPRGGASTEPSSNTDSSSSWTFYMGYYRLRLSVVGTVMKGPFRSSNVELMSQYCETSIGHAWHRP